MQLNTYKNKQQKHIDIHRFLFQCFITTVPVSVTELTRNDKSPPFTSLANSSGNHLLVMSQGSVTVK